MKKKFIPVVALSVLVASGLCACDNTATDGYYAVAFHNEDSGDDVFYTLTGLDNNNIVSEKVVKVKKGEALNVKITFDYELTDLSSFTEYGSKALEVVPHAGLLDYIQDASESENDKMTETGATNKLDYSNYTLTPVENKPLEWIVNIPKNVMNKSYDIYFEVTYHNLDELYGEEINDFFNPYTEEQGEKGKTNILCDDTKINGAYCDSLKIKTGLTSKLEPISRFGYTFTDDHLNNLEVYGIYADGTEEKLEKGVDYTASLDIIKNVVTGSKMEDGYACGSQGIVFNVPTSKLVKKDDEKGYVARFADIRTYIPTSSKAEIPNTQNVSECNKTNSVFNINSSKAEVTEYLFNPANDLEKQVFSGYMYVTLKVKEGSKYRFPTLEEWQQVLKSGENLDYLPLQSLSVVSKLNNFAVKYFDPYNAAVVEEESEDTSVINVKDAYFGAYTVDDFIFNYLVYKDNYGWYRDALSNSIKFTCSDDGKSLTVVIDIRGFIKGVEYAGSRVVGKNGDGTYYLYDDSGNGSVNFIDDCTFGIEPTIEIE